MRNFSVLLAAALGLFVVGCKPGPTFTTFPTGGGSSVPTPNSSPILNQNQLPNPSSLPNNGQAPMPTPIGSPIQPNNAGAGLAGTYHVDTENFNMQMHGQTPPREQLEQIVIQLKQSLSSVSLTLNADGTYQCSAAGQSATGHYSVNGSSLQFQEDHPSGQPLPQVSVAPDGSKLLMHIEIQAAGVDVNLIR